jgi:hypothetical protein
VSARTGAAPALRRLIGAIGADLERDEVRRGPCGTTSAVSLPWNIGRTNAARRRALDRRDVGDERAIQRAASFGAKSRVW